MFAGFGPGAFADPPGPEDAALSAPGPWLRVTYTMTPGASGHTVWMEEGALADPAAHLHLYGKTQAPEGRKMGHITRLEWPDGEGSE